MTESRVLNLGGGAAGTTANITTAAGIFTLNTNLTYNGNVANDNYRFPGRHAHDVQVIAANLVTGDRPRRNAVFRYLRHRLRNQAQLDPAGSRQIALHALPLQRPLVKPRVLDRH